MPARLRVIVVAAICFLYAAGLAALAALAAGSWLRGKPLISPLEVFDPSMRPLVEGQPFPLPVQSPPLVSAELIRAAALGLLGVLALGALVWGFSGAGLLARRVWGKAMSYALLGFALFTGVANIATALASAAMLGHLAPAEGHSPLAAVLPGVAGFAFFGGFLPLVALLLLRGVPASWWTRPAGGRSMPPLVAAVTLHFGLVAFLAGLAALLPARMLEPRTLVGPWLLEGTAARLATLLLALLHGAICVAFLRRARWGLDLGVALNVGLALLLAVSALTAGDSRFAAVAAGVPAVLLRSTAWLLSGSGLLLALTLQACRRWFARSAA